MQLDEENTNKILDKLEIIQLRLEKIELQHEQLLEKFNKHVDFINETYEGLRNPIKAAKRFLGTRN
tara:strand:+ start:2948 stop:3145 length:198 start_codon:yes stop_codon:yes gene_type:complete